MTTMIMLSAAIAANTTTPSIANNCPRFFFGTPAASIHCEQDCLNAIRTFCEQAPTEVIEATASELKTLSEVNPNFYEAINSLLWKVDFPLNSYAWHNHFKLLNKHLD